jgi:hypothetical protein
VDDHVDRGTQRLERDAEAGGDITQAVDEADRGIRGRRQRLEDGGLRLVADDEEIRERTADVDPDPECYVSIPCSDRSFSAPRFSCLASARFCAVSISTRKRSLFDLDQYRWRSASYRFGEGLCPCAPPRLLFSSYAVRRDPRVGGRRRAFTPTAHNARPASDIAAHGDPRIAQANLGLNVAAPPI